MQKVSKLKLAVFIIGTIIGTLVAPAHGQTTTTTNTPAVLTNVVPVVVPAAPAPVMPSSSTISTDGITAFVQDAYSWVTTFGTNTWNTNSNHGFLETGATYQDQLEFAFTLDVGIDIYSFSTNSGLVLEDDMLNGSVAGTIISDSVDLDYRYDVHDLQILAGGGAGYDKVTDKPYAELKLELQKKITATTYLFGGISVDLERNHGTETGIEGRPGHLRATAGAGVTF